MNENEGIDWTKDNLADALGRPDLKKFLAQGLRAIPSKKRSEASRQNGKKGGRPKKSATPSS